jgi:hypothetical protein
VGKLPTKARHYTGVKQLLAASLARVAERPGASISYFVEAECRATTIQHGQ